LLSIPQPSAREAKLSNAYATGRRPVGESTPHVPVSAASFSWMKWSSHAPGWYLNFVWIAGTWRRKGMLSRRWSAWLHTYGAFTMVDISVGCFSIPTAYHDLPFC